LVGCPRRERASEVERFTLFTLPPTGSAGGQALRHLASPSNGGVVSLQTINAQRYIDVTFFSPTGAQIDASSIDGNELRITGAGAANLAKNADGTVIATVLRTTGNTWRYLLTTRTGVDPKETFVAGEVNVQVVAGSWRAGTGETAAAAARSDEVFTILVAADLGAAPDAISLGPLSLQGPSIGIAKMQSPRRQALLTVAIGVDVASIGSAAARQRRNSLSGITAQLTGLLGTFDIAVDVAAALSAITGGGNIASAFSVPGKFGIQISGLAIEIPNVFKVTASGIIFNWDPNYDPAQNGGQRQRILVVQQASISFPSFGITGQINPNDGAPGLVVYIDGFDIGEAQLIYKPGGGAGSNTTQTGGGSGKISIAGLLEFDDLRIGVTNFKVTFGEAVVFNGTHLRRPRARRLPAPVSAIITDRLSAEPDIAPGVPDTEAIRLSLEFEDGRVKGFVFEADTLRITLGSVLALTATGVLIDTSAAADEEMASFLSAGPRIGRWRRRGQELRVLGDGPRHQARVRRSSPSAPRPGEPAGLAAIHSARDRHPVADIRTASRLCADASARSPASGHPGTQFSGSTGSRSTRQAAAREFPIPDIA
jgi:hypothetical protein